MKSLKTLVLSIVVIMAISCGKDDTNKSSTKKPTYSIVNYGNAGVTSITDTLDYDSLDIAQAIPSVSANYPLNMPIILFFNDKIYLKSLEDNFSVTQNGIIVGGTISVNEGSNGYAIVTFVPYKPFVNNAIIEITIDQAVSDDGGNGLNFDFVITYNTESAAVGSFDDNKGFENLDTTGVSFIGDGKVLNGSQGTIAPEEGQQFAAITSGNQLVSSNSCIGEATSMMILGPINQEISSLSFYYDFVSSEFQEYVGSVFDDCAMITVVGPKGSYTELITSVNTIAENNTECTGFAGLPDNGDTYAGHTDWVSKTYNFTNVGSPCYIIYTVTDVSDHIYSSALLIDNITY